MFFPSPMEIGDGVSGVTFSGNATNCPRCGGMASIGDGGIGSGGQASFFFRDAMMILSTAEARPLLQQLKVEIQVAQSSGASTEQVAKNIEQNFPSIASSIVRLLKQADSMGFGIAGVLALLLQAIQMCCSSSSVTNIPIAPVVEVTSENDKSRDTQSVRPKRRSNQSHTQTDQRMNRKQRRAEQSRARNRKSKLRK